jgi:hypothetical protein
VRVLDGGVLLLGPRTGAGTRLPSLGECSWSYGSCAGGVVSSSFDSSDEEAKLEEYLAELAAPDCDGNRVLGCGDVFDEREFDRLLSLE